MSKYYVKMEDLATGGTSIIDSSSKMNEEIESIKKAVESIEWEGTASENYFNLVNEKMKKVEKISGLYDVFGKFMKQGSEGFTNVNNNIQKGFEDMKNTSVTGTSNVIGNSQTCPKCGSAMVNGICPICGYGK